MYSRFINLHLHKDTGPSIFRI